MNQKYDELYHYGILGMKWRVHRRKRKDRGSGDDPSAIWKIENAARKMHDRQINADGGKRRRNSVRSSRDAGEHVKNAITKYGIAGQAKQNVKSAQTSVRSSRDAGEHVKNAITKYGIARQANDQHQLHVEWLGKTFARKMRDRLLVTARKKR